MDNIQPAMEPRVEEPVRGYDRKLSCKDSYKVSFLESLAENIGNYVIAEFCFCSIPSFDRRDGILHAVGTDYITLYQEDDDSYVMCDLSSLKFITFFDTRTRSRNSRYIRR